MRPQTELRGHLGGCFQSCLGLNIYNIHFSFNVTLLTPEGNSICGLKYRNISEGTENKAIFKKKTSLDINESEVLFTGSCDSAIKAFFFQLVLASGTGRRSSNSLCRRGSGSRVMSRVMNSGANRPLLPPAVAAEMLCSGSVRLAHPDKFPIQN